MKRTLIYISFLFLCAGSGAAKVSLPMPTQYVVDNAGIISTAYEQRLNDLLKELEQKTGVVYCPDD